MLHACHNCLETYEDTTYAHVAMQADDNDDEPLPWCLVCLFALLSPKAVPHLPAKGLPVCRTRSSSRKKQRARKKKGKQKAARPQHGKYWGQATTVSVLNLGFEMPGRLQESCRRPGHPQP